VIPQTFAALLAFLVFVAPGLTYQLVRERRVPSYDETAFRETSRVALTSLIFSLAAISLLAAASTKTTALPDLAAWYSTGNTYVKEHFSQVVLALVTQVALACLLAGLSARLLTLKSEATLSRKGPWFLMFREEKPKGTVPWLHVRMDDDTDVWGYLRSYSDPTKNDPGIIVLGGTTLKWQRKGESKSSLFGDSWDAIWLPADKMRYVRVIYRDEPADAWLGRATKDQPQGIRRQCQQRLKTDPLAAVEN
jgi:hypothetical protein